jgi:hypothetical protein
VSPAVGTQWFRESSGIRPVSLVPVSGRHLSFAEREEIAILRAGGCGVREIAKRTGRAPSTISRELRRNAGTRGDRLEYRAATAQWHADLRARRPKIAKPAANQELREYVQERLAGAISRPDGGAVPGPDVRWTGRRHGPRADRRWARAWSPEQIANRGLTINPSALRHPPPECREPRDRITSYVRGCVRLASLIAECRTAAPECPETESSGSAWGREPWGCTSVQDGSRLRW